MKGVLGETNRSGGLRWKSYDMKKLWTVFVWRVVEELWTEIVIDTKIEQ
jgi:hypothetical protein